MAWTVSVTVTGMLDSILTQAPGTRVNSFLHV